MNWTADFETTMVSSDLFELTTGADVDHEHPTSDLAGVPSSWGTKCLKVGGASTGWVQLQPPGGGAEWNILDGFTAEFDFHSPHAGDHAWYTYPFSIYSSGFYANELWLRDGFYGSSGGMEVAVGYYSDNFESFTLEAAIDRSTFHHIKMSITSTPTPQLKAWLNSTLAIDTTLAGQFWSSNGAPANIIPEVAIVRLGGFHGNNADIYFDNIRIVAYEATSDPAPEASPIYPRRCSAGALHAQGYI